MPPNPYAKPSTSSSSTGYNGVSQQRLDEEAEASTKNNAAAVNARWTYGNTAYDPNVDREVNNVRTVGTQGQADLASAGAAALRSSKDLSAAISSTGAQQGKDVATYGQTAASGVKAVGDTAAGRLRETGIHSSATVNDAAKSVAAQGAGTYGYGQSLGSSAGDYQGRTGAQADLSAADASQRAALQGGARLADLESSEGPSAAQAQLRSGLGQSASQALAIARSGRGYGASASALKQAAVQNAAASQQAVNSAASLRAQESSAWRARQAANLGTAASLAAGVGGQQGQQAAANAALAQQQLAQNDQATLSQQQQAIAAQQAGAAAAAQAGQLNVSAGQIQLGAEQAAASSALQGRTAAGQLGLQATTDAANLTTQAQQYGASLVGQGYAQDLGAIQAGVNAGLSGEQMAQQIYGTQLNAGIAREQNATQRYGIQQGVAVAQSQQNAAIGGAILGAVGTVGGALVGGPAGAVVGGTAGAAAGRAVGSDERIKKNVKGGRLEAVISDIDSLLDRMGGRGERVADGLEVADKAKAKSYEYKDPGRYGRGEWDGVMAQDLERTRSGPELVSEAPDGTKMVDVPRLSMATAAGLSGLSDRLRELESRIESIGRKKGRAA